MRYIKPDYYDKFNCIADKCPDTCCAGWQIVIDEDSLDKYKEESSSFSERLRTSIDWQEGVFCHKENKRCAFLNEKNLCDLYTALGHEALCDTCQNYPRHVEEFEGLRELSLSLSCPVAAEMILSAKEFPEFIEYENDEPEELEDEFEDFDLLLFTQLEEARCVSFEILKCPEYDFFTKLHKVLALAKEMDECVGEGRYGDIDDVVRKHRECGAVDVVHINRYAGFKDNFEVFNNMELLREEWQETRDNVWSLLYAEDEEYYNNVVNRFNEHIDSNVNEGIDLEQIAVNLFVTFMYTWFCGAVYSGWVYSKMAMSAFCTCYILEFIMAEWLRQGEQISLKDCVDITYRFTREVEHSDINLGILEDWFIEE